MSESLSVYGRYVVGLLSVWVRDCRSAVGYESSIVLMIGFQSVSCRLSIGLKSGDSIPNLTRHEPDWFYGVFSNIVGGRQLADSVKNLCFLSVSCRFGRCDWGMSHSKWCAVLGRISAWAPQKPVRICLMTGPPPHFAMAGSNYSRLI